jgi:uncharacterized protein
MPNTVVNENVRRQVGIETISLTIVRDASGHVPTVLFLHGAGTSSGARVSYLTKLIAERGVSSVAMDFSGHGASTGTLQDSSLAKRTLEARMALRLLSKEHIVVCGSSMGAHVAIRMLEYAKVESLILFCPAVYSQDAFTVPFNRGFSKLIREPGSWQRSETFGMLQRFKGRLLIFVGEKDDVIPTTLPLLLREAAREAYWKELITIPMADHKLHNWLQQHPSDADRVAQQIVGCLGQERHL